MTKQSLRLITDNDKKRLLIEMLDKLDNIFSSNDITYYLAYGTLLGAVRHQGFIPWDDDIDLLIPRKDFIRLIHLFEEQKEHFNNLHLEIVEYGPNKKDYYKRFKIADTRTVMEEYGENRSAVFIDIFPLDCFPNKPLKTLKKLRKKILMIDNLCSLCNAKINQSFGIKRIIYGIILFLHKILNCDKMKRFYENKLVKATRFRENGIVCSSESGYGDKEFSLASYWSKTQKLSFENHNFDVPFDYHSILSNLYGDYMTPPPKNQRCSHEYYTMYWRGKE